uniref:Uncharacterized protein n=1 Tax=Acrobeloides nanus TaxID=290746 RepID=A0A914DJE7_9BILA
MEKRILKQDTTPEDLSKIKKLKESLMQDEKIFTTPRPIQLEIGNKQETVKQSPLATYYTIPYPKQVAHGGGAPVNEYKTQNFRSTAPPIEPQSKERNHPCQDLPETSSQSSNDKQSKKSPLEHYKEHSSFFDNVKCILMIDFFRVVPLEKIHFEDKDALKTFVPIEAVPNLLEHNTPIYVKLVHSEQHNTSNLATWFVINGKYFCNRWHYSSKNYDSSGTYVFNCAGVENKNHGGKRTPGEKGGENSKLNKCQGSIWIKVDLEQRVLTIGKKKDHTKGYCCLRNLFKIFHNDCRHMVSKNESMEDAIEEFENLLQDLKNHLQNTYQLNVSSPSNEEADKEDYFTYKKSVKVNGIIRKSADLQFFDRVFKIDQKSTNRNQTHQPTRIPSKNYEYNRTRIHLYES